MRWKKILVNTAWILLAVGTIVLSGAAMRQKNQKKCTAISVEISGAEKHMFIDEADVMTMLNEGGALVGKPIEFLRLRKMEKMVEQNPWVKNAEMFFDNQQVLQVRIAEKEPVARLFQTNGASFYIDTAMDFLPLSAKLTARVPVFTGVPNQQKKDTTLLKQIIQMANYINADSFFTAQISQIVITPEKQFELIPLIGDHLVVFGDATDVADKFKKLNSFYRAAWLQQGIYAYEQLNIQYKNQVVGIKSGTAKMYADSSAAMQLLQIIDTIKPVGNAKMLMPLNNKQKQNPLTTKRNTL